MSKYKPGDIVLASCSSIKDYIIIIDKITPNGIESLFWLTPSSHSLNTSRGTFTKIQRKIENNILDIIAKEELEKAIEKQK